MCNLTFTLHECNHPVEGSGDIKLCAAAEARLVKSDLRGYASVKSKLHWEGTLLLLVKWSAVSR